MSSLGRGLHQALGGSLAPGLSESESAKLLVRLIAGIVTKEVDLLSNLLKVQKLETIDIEGVHEVRERRSALQFALPLSRIRSGRPFPMRYLSQDVADPLIHFGFCILALADEVAKPFKAFKQRAPADISAGPASQGRGPTWCHRKARCN